MIGRRSESLIFLHLMKTGGLTAWDVLRRQFRRGRTLKILGRRFEDHVEEIRRLDDPLKENLDLIAGHMYFGLHRDLPRPSRYFTVLRRPDRRVRSLYYYLRDQADTELREPLQTMGLAEFVQRGLHPQADNGQVRFVAGVRDAPYGGVTSTMLDTARSNIEEFFVVAGVTELFDASLLLLSEILGFQMPCYVRQNVNPSHPRRDLTVSERAIIMAHNELDLQLYEFVRSRFEREIKARPGFDRRLAYFQLVNRHLASPIIGWQRNGKRVIDRLERHRYDWLPG